MVELIIVEEFSCNKMCSALYCSGFCDNRTHHVGLSVRPSRILCLISGGHDLHGFLLAT